MRHGSVFRGKRDGFAWSSSTTVRRLRVRLLAWLGGRALSPPVSQPSQLAWLDFGPLGLNGFGKAGRILARSVERNRSSFCNLIRQRTATGQPDDEGNHLCVPAWLPPMPTTKRYLSALSDAEGFFEKADRESVTKEGIEKKQNFLSSSLTP